MKEKLLIFLISLTLFLFSCSNQGEISSQNDSIPTSDAGNESTNQVSVETNKEPEKIKFSKNIDSLFQQNCPCKVNELEDLFDADEEHVKLLHLDEGFLERNNLRCLGILFKSDSIKVIGYHYSMKGCPAYCPYFTSLYSFNSSNELIDEMSFNIYEPQCDVEIKVDDEIIKIDSTIYSLSEVEGPSGIPDREKELRRSKSEYLIAPNGKFQLLKK